LDTSVAWASNAANCPSVCRRANNRLTDASDDAGPSERQRRDEMLEEDYDITTTYTQVGPYE
jgi:hypothetical protein